MVLYTKGRNPQWRVDVNRIYRLMGLFLFTGCALFPSPVEKTAFFGIECQDIKSAAGFQISSYSKEDGVRYRCVQSSEVNAWGTIVSWGGYSYTHLRITLVNESTKPIPLNYFIDEFKALTENGIYELKKSDITQYPDGPLNPKQSARFSFALEPTFGDKLPRIDMIVCSFGMFNDTVLVVLKPIPSEVPSTPKISPSDASSPAK